MDGSKKNNKAFTLIELLIVVAIIAILAAIAVPNFLEAQTRAKISRCKSDQRTLATGLESYRIDFNDYPINMYSTAYYYDTNQGSETDPWGFKPIDHQRGRTVAACLFRVTTPVSYLTDVTQMASPFWPNQEYWDWQLGLDGVSRGPQDVGATYLYGACNAMTRQMPTVAMAQDDPVWPSSGMMKTQHNWFIYGPGPADLKDKVGTFWIKNTDQPYDASNGTISAGQIVRTGP